MTIPEALKYLENDGIEYIRIDNRALTDLGRMLDSQYIIPFYHPTLGQFNTIEGFIQYITLDRPHELLRVLNGHECRKYLKDLKDNKKLIKKTVSNTTDQLKYVNYLKIESSPKLKALFLANDLPYKIFYLNKDKNNKGCVVNRLLDNHGRLVSILALKAMYKNNPELQLPMPDCTEILIRHQTNS